jgi:hypothetical protein
MSGMVSGFTGDTFCCATTGTDIIKGNRRYIEFFIAASKLFKKNPGALNSGIICCESRKTSIF